MKKMIAGVAFAAFAISAQWALAHGTEPTGAQSSSQTATADCARTDKGHNKLMGGLAHSTEKCSSQASSGMSGSLPPDMGHDTSQSGVAQSGVAMTVMGSDCATDASDRKGGRKSGAIHAADFNRTAASCSASASASASTPLPADGTKIKTKSNIKNDRTASSSSSS